MRRRRKSAVAAAPSPSDATRYVLKLDGKPVTTGTWFDLMRWMHSTHPYSLDHALRWEGYSIQPLPYGSNKKRKPMKRSRRSKKGDNTVMILLGVGAVAAIYLFWSKQASGVALQANIAATTQGAASAAQYEATKSHILAAIQQDGPAAADVEPNVATQAYLRGDPTELVGVINALRGIGATNTAEIFTTRLDQVKAAPAAVSGW